MTDLEVGVGISRVHTLLRVIGPEPWRAIYMQPLRRPKDGRCGRNPNRLQHYYQYQVVLEPALGNILDLYFGSLEALGLGLKQSDVHFVEDDWEDPTLGVWGLGWEVWLNGMEVTQLTYFQQAGGPDYKPVTGEIIYGIERLAVYLQQVESIYDLVWTEREELGPNGPVKRRLTYGDVYHQNEVEQSTYNFEQVDTTVLFRRLVEHEAEAKRLMGVRAEGNVAAGGDVPVVQLTLSVYKQVLKADHTLNLLDACGAVLVTERVAYIGRIRNLPCPVAQAYYDSCERLGFPMCGTVVVAVKTTEAA